MPDPTAVASPMSFLGNMFSGMNLASMAKIGGIVLGAGVIILGVIWYIWNKVQWNLRVEFKLTRSGGSFIDSEWGKGSFNTRKGVVWLKRPKQKKVYMKPFDVKEYLQGGNILTVEQIGAKEYLPVHPDSFKTVVDEWIDEKGVKHDTEVSIMSIRGNTTEDKAWASSFERESESAYSITNFLREHGALIAMGIVLLLNMVGFAILWSKIKG